MKHLFDTGDVKIFEKKVGPEDVAGFDSGTVHEVYATFALGRDAEWSSRLFVLEMKEDDEEGIGTFLNITHHAPALVGESVVFKAVVSKIEGNSIDCEITAMVGNRLIATCRTGQKILRKKRLEDLFANLSNT